MIEAGVPLFSGLAHGHSGDDTDMLTFHNSKYTQASSYEEM